MARHRLKLATVAAIAMCSAPAFAQPAVFFDDFDGDALLPHWNQPPPSAWEYNVSDSMLNVTGLFSPSHPKSPTNFAAITARNAFTPLGDFQLDVRMGWDTTETISRFELTMLFKQGGVATIGYRQHGANGQPGIFAGTSGGVMTIPAPGSGMFDFRLARVGTTFNFYFEEMLFASLPSAYTGPIDGVAFFFASPYPGQSGPFYIDNVQIVPAPAPILCIALSIILNIPKRRR